MNRNDFEAKVVAFLNRLCRRKAVDVQVEPTTHLFETKILDSVQFLELMSFLQSDLGVEVPDSKLSTEFFQTARKIAENFGRDPAVAEAS
jgi:acyl carrier protein